MQPDRRRPEVNDPGGTTLAKRFMALYTGALTDVLYQLGVTSQTLPPSIGPLRTGMRLAGPVFTVEARPDVSEVDGVDQMEVLQKVPDGHAIVWATGADDHSVIGDLAVALLKVRGCSGLVIDGGCRDVDFVAELGLPIFCRFVTPQDMSHGRGAIVGCGRSVTIGGVSVAPDDYVVADSDGAVVVPAALVDEVLERAEALVIEETAVRSALLRGASWEEAFGDASSPPEQTTRN